MKKKLFALAIAAIILAGAVTGTVAYYTAKTVAHNVITTGEIDIELVETMKNDKGEIVDYVNNASGLMPGQTHSKIVQIANVGTNPARVPIKVEVELENEKGADLPADQLAIAFDDEHWEKKADGLYYYTAKLEPGKSTAPLFEEVLLKTSIDNDYQNAKISISVKAEGIQYENNTEYATAWPTGVQILPLLG